MLPGAGLYTSVRPPPRCAARRRLASSAVAFLTVSCVLASTTAGRLGVRTSLGGCPAAPSRSSHAEGLKVLKWLKLLRRGSHIKGLERREGDGLWISTLQKVKSARFFYHLQISCTLHI